ncbi:hypothetical protein B0J11DRAFT_578669 [Dendryphion nanum]|uniref:Uncharacterized protein n=1 Tax=Dendryphion nanum TaxID=256645 RepID=A0A9P9IPP9_9PLEO|nr:hypothetical protein B0J11DRAFT_578669 [Dendryphion nanum]
MDPSYHAYPKPLELTPLPISLPTHHLCNIYLIQFEPKIGREESASILGVFSSYSTAFTSLQTWKKFLTLGISPSCTSTWSNGHGLIKIVPTTFHKQTTSKHAVPPKATTLRPSSAALPSRTIFLAIESTSLILHVEVYEEKRDAFTACGRFLQKRTELMKLCEGRKWMDEDGLGHIKGRSGGVFMKTDWHHWYVARFQMDEMR